jgi:dihydroneopterin aldolase
LLAEQRFGLVEELAQFVANLVLGEFQAPWVRVSVAKLGILKDVKLVGVVIERGTRA